MYDFEFYTDSSDRLPEFMHEAEQRAIEFFNNSYRHPLITTRAAGLFGRKWKIYKKKKGI